MICQPNAATFAVLTPKMPSLTDSLAKLAMSLCASPQILPTGRVRDLLVQSLPDTNLKDALASCTDAQTRRLMVHYSFMVQSYVWGEPEAPTVLPRCLAMPMVAIAGIWVNNPYCLTVVIFWIIGGV